MMPFPDADPETCKVADFGTSWSLRLFGTSGSDSYEFTLVVDPYDGPGTYAAGPGESTLKGHFETFDRSGFVWGGPPAPDHDGRVGMDADGTAGSFDITLRATVNSPLPESSLLHVTGTFNCSGSGGEATAEPGPTSSEDASCPSGQGNPDQPVAAVGPLALSPGEADLAIDHVEFVQVVQKADNSVPLVTFKSTIVRVFVRKLTQTTDTVGARVSLTGPTGEQLFCVLALDTIDRGQFLANEAQFRLPQAATSSGDWSFVAEVVPIAGVVDPVAANNKVTVPVTFDDRAERTQIGWIPVCLARDPAGRASSCPSSGDLRSVADWGSVPQKMFPIRDGYFGWFRLPGPDWVWEGPTWWQRLDPLISRSFWLGSWLRSQYSVAAAESWKQIQQWPEAIVGVVPGDAPFRAGGEADAVHFGNNGPDSGHTVWLRASANGMSLAHELGHLWELNHVQDAQCDRTAAFPAAPPYDVLPSGNAAIGEAGMDISTDGTAVVVPATRADVMSYCLNSPQWISPEHYTTLYRNRMTRPASGGGVLALTGLMDVASEQTTHYLVVTGGVARDGSEGVIGPTMRVTSAAGARSATTDGQFCLESRGASGALGETCFDPAFSDAETGEEFAEAPFSEVVPMVDGMTELALTAEGVELTTIHASANAPVVAAESHAGETWTESRDMSWSVTDADGDRARVSVLYSPDGGELWLPYAPDWVAETLTVDPSDLQAGSTNMFRILATDDLNGSSFDVGPITVPASVGLSALLDGEQTDGGSGECALARDCKGAPGGQPGASPGLDPIVLMGLVGLVGLVAVGIVVAVVIGRRRAPAYAFVEPAAIAPPPATFSATHAVPPTGLSAWAMPDSRNPAVQLSPGLEVMVTEWRPDGWARIVAPNGWSGWVDGRLLTAKAARP
jgi:hypothetical protein